VKYSGDFGCFHSKVNGEFGVCSKPWTLLNSSVTGQTPRKQPFRWKVIPEILAVVVISEANYLAEVLQLKNKSRGTQSEYMKL